MKLYGIEKLSLVDYDGKIACTVFTGGCNFRCPFCHNAPLVENLDKLSTQDNEEIFEYLKMRKNILEGVCITGGEPTLHKDLPQLCEKIKELGYAVKLDTNGTNTTMVKELVENRLIDYVAMDIKNAKDNYSEIIGINNYDVSAVENTVSFLLADKIDFEFRTTLIKEFHTAEDMKKIGEWIKGTKKYFLQKFKEVDTCLTKNLTEVPLERAKDFLQIVSQYIPTSKLRGY